MTVWMWVLSGIAGAILLSLIVGLLIARLLGIIASQISAVVSEEAWTSAPLTRSANHGKAAAALGVDDVERSGALEPHRFR
jgi:hypothetical protein